MAQRPAKARQKSGPKVAIVTGGGTGIGRGVANRLVRDGYVVAVLGRRAAKLKPKRGESFHPYACDIADFAQIKSTVAAIRRDLGRIDLLVNNAGVLKRQRLENITQDAIAYTLGINLVGTMNMCLACLPALKASKGAIVNVSSSLTERCYPEYAVYAASKGGMNAWSRTLAVELAPAGVRVNVVNPSLVRSEIFLPDGMAKADYDSHLVEMKNYFPLGRAGEPGDIAAAVSYLASADAGWVTGIVLTVDGGEAAGLRPK